MSTCGALSLSHSHSHYQSLMLLDLCVWTPLTRYDRQHPLALAAFSNSSQTLESFASAIATALFGDAPATRANVQVLDMAQLVPQTLRASTNRDVKQQLRLALGTALAACPERSLFVVANVHVLNDATLPVLDTFLDPLNGKRAHFQQHAPSGGASRLLDASNAVFLFLFEVEPTEFALVDSASDLNASADSSSSSRAKHTWRDFLMRTWTRREGLTEEFTPQALVGRLTDGVTLFTGDEHDAPVRTCRIHEQRSSPADSAGDAPLSRRSAAVLQRVLWAGIPVLALLYRTKRWTQDVAVKRASRGPIKGKKSHAKRAKRSSSGKKSRKR